MAEGARILWCIAIDSSSPALQIEDFMPALAKHMSECRVMPSTDQSKTVMKLRLQKRLRPTPIAQALRQLLQDGRVQRAWVERPDGPERVQTVDGPRLEMEMIGLKKKKGNMQKKRQNGVKKQRKSAPGDEEEQECLSSEEEAGHKENEEEMEEGEDEMETTGGGGGNHLDLILSTIDHLERQHRTTATTLRDLKRKVVALIRNKGEGSVSSCAASSSTLYDSTGEDKEEQPVQKLIPPPYIKLRQPIRLSWLRTASVSELYFAGVWFPNHDVNDAIPPSQAPPRQACFRSELHTTTTPPEQQYLEDYDIDDLLHPDGANPYLKDKPAALKREGILHFTDGRYRPAVLLSALRSAPYDVLHQLNVFHLDYDIDDENPQPHTPPQWGRLTRTQICDKWKFRLDFCDWETKFIKGYDINDVATRDKVKHIKYLAEEWKKEFRERISGPQAEPDDSWKSDEILKSCRSLRKATQQ